MVGPIERLRRLLPARHLAPMVMLVVCANAQVDPVRRATGYGGVLPVPGPAPAPSAASRTDAPPADQQHRDLRASRGRVLYAPGHAPRDTVPVRPARTQKQCPSPEQRVGQGRGSVSVRTS